MSSFCKFCFSSCCLNKQYSCMQVYFGHNAWALRFASTRAPAAFQLDTGRHFCCEFCLRASQSTQLHAGDNENPQRDITVLQVNRNHPKASVSRTWSGGHLRSEFSASRHAVWCHRHLKLSATFHKTIATRCILLRSCHLQQFRAAQCCTIKKNGWCELSAAHVTQHSLQWFCATHNLWWTSSREIGRRYFAQLMLTAAKTHKEGLGCGQSLNRCCKRPRQSQEWQGQKRGKS